jgi:hypothetical protein
MADDRLGHPLLTTHESGHAFFPLGLIESIAGDRL